MKTIRKSDDHCFGLTHHHWATNEDPITFIDFSTFGALISTRPHLSVVTVLTSHGETGTMTHLHPESNLSAFLEKLNELHEKKPYVILVGNFNNKGMKEFHKKLVESLKENNYEIKFEFPVEPNINTSISLYANKVITNQIPELSSPSSEESEEKRISNKVLRRVSTSELFTPPPGEQKKENVTEIPFPIIISYQRTRSSSTSSPPPTPTQRSYSNLGSLN